MVDALDEPIGDPAAINTLLMCEAARERGVKVILSGMGADELFGGYRKHLACVMAGRYRRLPGYRARWCALRGGPVPVSFQGRGLRYARWAKRFLTFAELPEEPRFRRSYTLYDPDELAALVSPDLAAMSIRSSRGIAVSITTTRWTTKLTACAWPIRGCSCPASTWPIPTGRAWRLPSRCVSRSSTQS